MPWLKKNVVVAAALIFLAVGTTFGQTPVMEYAKPGNLILNGDFEQGTKEWSADWDWADVDASMRCVTAEDVYAGKGALEVICSRYDYGRTQWHSSLFKAQPYKAYKVSFYARAHGFGKLTAEMRMRPVPYTIHFRQTFSLLPQWQHFEMVGAATETKRMDETGLFFGFFGEGTIWIDNVTVTQIDLPKKEPRDTGNLIRNGSFEVDPITDDWNSNARDTRFGWEIDPSTSSHGERSFKGRGRLSSGFYTLRPLVLHTLSLDLKSDRPCCATIKLMGRRYTPIFQKDVEAGTDWKRLTLSGNSKIALDNQYYLLIENGDGALLWVDGVYLAEGNGQSAYRPSAPVEASARVVPDVSKVFNAGDSVMVKLRLSNNAWKEKTYRSDKLPYTWSLINIYGETEATGRGEATADKPEVPLSLAPKRLGMYRVKVLPAGGAKSEDVFTVVHRREKSPDPNSPFGAHFTFDPVPLDIMKKVGIAKERCHWPPVTTQWTCIEPEKGKFQFNDTYVATAKQQGIHLLGSLAATPAWAHDGKNSTIYITQYPTQLEDWRNYVRRTVKHFSDIREWEIFNEPEWKEFYQGTDEQLMRLFFAAAEEIKSIDPNLKIVAFANAFPTKMVEKYLPLLKKHDALKYLSAVSVHLYAPGGMKSDVYIDRLEELIGTMRAFLNEAGHPEIEIWDTESGRCPVSFRRAWRTPEDDDGTKEERSFFHAEEFFKLTVSNLSAGVDRIYTYVIEGSIDIERAFEYTFLDLDRGPRPVISALTTLVRFLESAKPLGKINAGDANLRVYHFRQGDKDILIVWSKDGSGSQTIDITGLEAFEVYDAMGNGMDTSVGQFTISTHPAVIVIPRDQFQTLITRLR